MGGANLFFLPSGQPVAIDTVCKPMNPKNLGTKVKEYWEKVATIVKELRNFVENENQPTPISLEPLRQFFWLFTGTSLNREQMTEIVSGFTLTADRIASLDKEDVIAAKTAATTAVSLPIGDWEGTWQAMLDLIHVDFFIE